MCGRQPGPDPGLIMNSPASESRSSQRGTPASRNDDAAAGGSTAASRMRQMTALGADWWNDSGVPDELGEAVALGAVGGTSNPVIVSQAVKAQPALCNAIIDRLVREHPHAIE